MAQRSILAALLCAVALAAAPAAVLAQAQDAKVSREREALRRSQAALRQAQEQQTALARDKAALEAEKKDRDDALQRAGAQLAGVRGEAGRLQQRIAELGLELEQLRAASTREREAAARNGEALATRLAALDRLLAERTQAVAAIRELLVRSTTALAAAEEANRKMYGFGREMIEAYRQATPAEQFLQSEPVVGFAAVRRENAAEELRSKLDATRLPAAPAR